MPTVKKADITVTREVDDRQMEYAAHASVSIEEDAEGNEVYGDVEYTSDTELTGPEKDQLDELLGLEIGISEEDFEDANPEEDEEDPDDYEEALADEEDEDLHKK